MPRPTAGRIVNVHLRGRLEPLVAIVTEVYDSNSATPHVALTIIPAGGAPWPLNAFDTVPERVPFYQDYDSAPITRGTFACYPDRV